VIAEQMLKISQRYQVVLTVHDAVACIAPENEAQKAKEYVESCMRWRPDWAKDLPLNCESGMGKSYGEC
jgi:DNA polymerase I-like protein with 3'-5' exonuclease and polymerase domains